jgi:transcriptional regulator with XRE-family HTH domain
MSFKSWREKQLLSQEKVAEMSGLSLRTIQRLEAGHRVSYGSLRALAATYEVDVDLLEREFYAVDKPADEEFVEIPRWVRIMDDTRWFGSPGPSRRDAHLIELFHLGMAIGFFVASLMVASGKVANILRVGAAVLLLGAYMVSRYIRVSDRYQLWRFAEGAAPMPLRTWKSRVAQYGYAFGVGLLSIVLVCWLAI